MIGCVVEWPLLKPYWWLYKILLLSRKEIIWAATILSNSLENVLKREVGQKFVNLFFSSALYMRSTLLIFSSLGTYPNSRDRFITWSRGFKIIGAIILSVLLDIRSSPKDVLFLSFEILYNRSDSLSFVNSQLT